MTDHHVTMTPEWLPLDDSVPLHTQVHVTVEWHHDDKRTIEVLHKNTLGYWFKNGEPCVDFRLIAWRKPMPWEVPFDGDFSK